jgi:cytochrome P450
MRETKIGDGKSTYLLKEGVDAQMPSAIAHLSPDIWSSDSRSFYPRRFMDQQDRAQKTAYFPFGEGKYLCPRKNLPMMRF